ncbi:MAG: hypothetical protein QOJ99_134 [Bryobacterales bacterium]|nr:hypothetical protein [Bryobacterales bacterium]
MAIDTPLHFDRLSGLHDLLLLHIAVAAGALDLSRSVSSVVEEDEIRNLVHAAGWNFPIRHPHMALPALRDCGKAGQILGRRAPVA